MTNPNTPNPGKLIIVRHHESEWNKLGVWTGSRDIHLTEHGFQMSEKMGILIKDIQIDEAIVSTQIRSYETLLGMEKTFNNFDIPTSFSPELNERDYGDYTGKNKMEVEKIVGEEEFKKIRRGWDCPIPHGETLKMVYERSVPYYLETILPKVLSGENVLIVSHGNAIRSLMKYIESISDEGISNIEMLFGSIMIYDVDEKGRMINKEIRGAPPRPPSGESETAPKIPHAFL